MMTRAGKRKAAIFIDAVTLAGSSALIAAGAKASQIAGMAAGAAAMPLLVTSMGMLILHLAGDRDIPDTPYKPEVRNTFSTLRQAFTSKSAGPAAILMMTIAGVGAGTGSFLASSYDQAIQRQAYEQSVVPLSHKAEISGTAHELYCGDNSGKTIDRTIRGRLYRINCP